jgi:SSS family solute:Na+ symporter
MSPGATALSIIFAIVVIGSFTGFLAARHRTSSLEEWAVAGRGLGLALVWILMAGETFTTFSVLGVSGWIYSKGGPTLYVLAYLTLGQTFIFFFGPAIWEHGRRLGLQTVGDFFAVRYRSSLLGAVVALAGAVFLVVYLQLQITGLGIIVEVASFEQIGRAPAMLAATAVVASFVMASGVRGVAWVSFLKDFLMVAVAVFVGFGLPWAHFGGIGAMFDAVIRAKPGHLVMPGGTQKLTHSWFITTVLVNSLMFAWPHFFGGIFTAKSADTVRKNAIIMPFYLLPLGLIIIAGCAAILIAPGISNGDLALLTAIRRTFGPGMLGVIGGAGALTAMVPAAIHILTASTLIAKNVYRPLFAPAMSDDATARVARLTVVAVTAVALALALNSSATLVGLLIMAYSGVAQFAPGIILGILSRRVSSPAVLAGLIGGLAVAGGLSFTGRDPFLGLNAGFIGLIVNVALVAGVGRLTPARPSGFE